MIDDMRQGIAAYTADDELLAAVRRDGLPRWHITHGGPTSVVLGRGSHADREVHLSACRQTGVPLYRRAGGGCAVVLDAGTVQVAVAAPATPMADLRPALDRFTDQLRDALLTIGIAGVQRAGVCDLTVNDRKICGACLYRDRDLLYFSASLLVCTDLSAIDRLLPHPPREPAYRRGRPHREFLTRLADLPTVVTPADLMARLQTAFDPRPAFGPVAQKLACGCAPCDHA